jgi:hypothetical protein
MQTHQEIQCNLELIKLLAAGHAILRLRSDGHEIALMLSNLEDTTDTDKHRHRHRKGEVRI